MNKKWIASIKIESIFAIFTVFSILIIFVVLSLVAFDFAKQTKIYANELKGNQVRNMALTLRSLILTNQRSETRNLFLTQIPENLLDCAEIEYPTFSDVQVIYGSGDCANRNKLFIIPISFDSSAQDIRENAIVKQDLAAVIKIKFKEDDSFFYTRNGIAFMVICFVILSLIIFLLVKLLSFILAEKINAYLKTLDRNIVTGVFSNEEFLINEDLDKKIRNSVLDIHKTLENHKNTMKINAQSVLLGQFAAQVAHDIRSPLAALSVAEPEFSILPEATRVMVRSSITRIRDIANHLLEKHRVVMRGFDNEMHTTETAVDQCEARSTQLLSTLIEEIVTEKRIQYRSLLDVEIEFILNNTSYGIFGFIQPTEFKRIVSNLINNSLEAIPMTGKVKVILDLIVDKVKITIADNGDGITKEILSSLGKRGNSVGKVNGSGLGLFHARTVIESWGGKLSIESDVGVGTNVFLNFPAVQAPPWFVRHLNFRNNTVVIAVDDDQSIHQIWDKRFNELCIHEVGNELLHISTPKDFLNFWSKFNRNERDILILMDYEFIGFLENGLEIIKSCNLASVAILVTSRFEDPEILAECNRIGVKLLPKSMAGFIPIKSVNRNDSAKCDSNETIILTDEVMDAILIDDDRLVHSTWAMAAKKCNKKVIHVYSALDVEMVLSNVSKLTPIYIDSDLDSGMKGEDIALSLYNTGFKEIYLVTGHDPGRFHRCTWIRKVLGKDPVWYFNYER